MLDSSLACVVLYTCAQSLFMAAFFRMRNIHTFHSPVYLCWSLECLRVSLCLWVPFLEQGVFTHLFCLFICARLIISVHGCFTAVRVRYELSCLVAVFANLVTRDPPTFSGVGVHYLTFTSTIPFRNMTSDLTSRQSIMIRDGS